MPRIIKTVQSQPKPERLLNVAAYARVSSGKDAMLHSLSAQVSFYSSMIQNHKGWNYAYHSRIICPGRKLISIRKL